MRPQFVPAASIVIINPLRNEATEDSQEASYIARMSFKFSYELVTHWGRVFLQECVCVKRREQDMSWLIILIQQYAPTAFRLATHEAIVHLSGSDNLVTTYCPLDIRKSIVHCYSCVHLCLCLLEQQFTVTY